MNEQDMDGKDDDANDAEMDQEAEEDEDEMINNANNGRDAEPEEEGEIDNEKLRNLTEEEQINLGAALGIEWKKLAGRLGFKKDEVSKNNSSYCNPHLLHFIKAQGSCILTINNLFTSLLDRLF